jgi:hypothetical protein
MANYVEITKGYMNLLKKGAPFIWDAFVQCSFDALKNTLASSPMLSPLDYRKYFLLYIKTMESIVGMVLV